MTETLVKVAIFGGFAIGFTGYTFRFAIQHKLRKSELYQEALKSVREHPEVVKNLGEPIIDGFVEIGKHENYGGDKNSGWVVVPLKGPKSTGQMQYWVKQGEKNDTIYVSRVEMTFNDVKDKKLLIKNSEST